MKRGPINKNSPLDLISAQCVTFARGSLLRVAFLVGLLSPYPAIAQISTSGASQISIGVGNTGPTGRSEDASACPNSNLIAFASLATNLTSSFSDNSQAAVPNVYLYSSTKGISLISKNLNGVAPVAGQVNEGSAGPSISAIAPDGSFAVAYISDARDLVANYSSGPGAEGSFPQAYVYLSATGQTLLISKSYTATGNTAANGRTTGISIALSSFSPVTYRLCFESQATNLIENATLEPGVGNIYCKEITLKSGVPSESPLFALKNQLGQGILSDVAVSPDGQVVAFASNAEILPSVGVTTGMQLYSYAFGANAFSLVTKNASGAPVQGSARYPTVTNAGATISFLYDPTGVTPDLPGFESISRIAFVQYTKSTGGYSRVNSSASGQVSDGYISAGSLDSTGRYAIFSDSGSNLIDGEQSSTQITHVYAKDLKTGMVVRVSVNAALVKGDSNSGIKFSETSLRIPVTIGRNSYNSPELYTVFTSDANNLATVGSPTANDGDTPFLYRSPLSVPIPPLTKNFVLETPPDIQIVSRDSKGLITIFLTFLKFKFDNSLFKSSDAFALFKAQGGRITYEYDLKRNGSKFRMKRTVTRNTTTIRKLSPGTYNVRYRVVATKGKKTIRSRYSPKTDIVLS